MNPDPESLAAGARELVRTFVAVSLPAPLLDKVTRIQRRLRAHPAAQPVRWARPEQLHLTLRFLGNVPRNELTRLGEALSSACAELRAFELGLAELGCFPHSRSPRVVWIGVTGAVTQLDGLERRVEEALRGFGDPAEEARAFHPHLTIGRVKARGDEGRRLGDLLARERVPELGAWPVRQVDLVQSELSPQSARHTVLHSVRLND
jgi:2'-5' RNA ligase